MERKDFWLLWKGFKNKLIYDQTIIRRLAYIMHISTVPKPAKIHQLWPLPGDSKVGIMDSKLRELLKRQKERKKKVK